MVDKQVVNDKPYVQIACVCEKVLFEPDKVVSLIRVVDTYTLKDAPDAAPPGFKFQTDLTAFVSLKSGSVVGRFEVGLRLISPDGQAAPVRKWPVELLGNEQGVGVKVDFTIQDPKLGLYWFDVLWGDDVLTKIPFRLQVKETATPSAAAE